MTAALAPSADLVALRLAAQIAARLVRPVGHVDPDLCALPPLAGPAVAAACANPAFRAPLNRAVARALRPDAAGIDAACLARLRTSPRTRLAALLVAEPEPVLHAAALRVAAAVLHPRIVTLVLRSERERVRAALGEAAFLVATQEAPLLHGPLAGIAGAGSDILGEPEALRARLVRLGLETLARFVGAVEPALAAIFRWRLPAPAGGAGQAAPLDPGMCDHIVRLLRRRMDAWSPIIA